MADFDSIVAFYFGHDEYPGVEVVVKVDYNSEDHESDDRILENEAWGRLEELTGTHAGWRIVDSMEV